MAVSYTTKHVLQPSDGTSGHLSHRNGGLLMFTQKTCMQMFIVGLFITVPNWKQSKRPSTGEGLNKRWCIPTMEHYSAIKKNELLIHGATQMDLFC